MQAKILSSSAVTCRKRTSHSIAGWFEFSPFLYIGTGQPKALKDIAVPKSIRPLSHHTALLHFVIFAIVILAFCLLGIATRPADFLASFWPANSVLLGLLIRFPHTRHLLAWLGAITGYMLADLVTGSAFILTAVLTTANLIYVAIVLWLYRYFTEQIHKTHYGYLYLFLLVFCALGSALGALFAVSAVPLVNTTFMQNPFIYEFSDWFSAEMQNAILVLPLIISYPPRRILIKALLRLKTQDFPWSTLLPVIALICSLLISYYDQGPGSLLFPIAALIWCALSYAPFPLALINTIACTVIIYHTSHQHLISHSVGYLSNILSIRMGAIMMALAPLTVSNINAARSKLIRELKHNASHDELTQSFNRRQFYQAVKDAMSTAKQKQQPFAILMLDIDHFKSINDHYGHQAGDFALQICANTIREHLRKSDIFGRLGGEEFAIMLSNVSREAAFSVAERIRFHLENKQFYVDEDQEISIQISIGISWNMPNKTSTLEELLHEADQALYQAKWTGRNKVVGPTDLYSNN